MLEWMPLPFAALVPVACVIVLAYVVYGLTGFGSSITALPLLVQFVPLRTAVPLMLIFDLGVGALMGLRNRRVIDRREVLRMVPYMLAGMLLGVTLLVKVPERVLLLVLGVFVLSYSAWSLLLRPAVKPISTRWVALFGVGGGIFTALFGTGGPIYTIYLARRLPDKTTLRATISALILFSALVRLFLFTGAGLYARPLVLPLAAILLPFALFGLFVGNHLHHRMPQHRVVQFVWTILILGGAGLLWRALV